MADRRMRSGRKCATPLAGPFTFITAVVLAALATSICIATAAPPERIVSAAPSLTEILFDMGLGDRIVGVTDFCDYPPEAAMKPKIGGFANPSLEAVIGLRPDIVMMLKEDKQEMLARRLKQLGVPHYRFGRMHIRELPRGIREVAAAVGMPERGRQRAAKMERDIRRIEAKAKAIRKKHKFPEKMKVLFIIHTEPLVVAGRNNPVDDALTILGLENVAAQASAVYPKYSLEAIVRQNPYVIFISGARGMYVTPGYARNLLARLSSLDAVQKGRVYYVSSAAFRLGPRVIPGMEEMLRHVDDAMARR